MLLSDVQNIQLAVQRRLVTYEPIFTWWPQLDNTRLYLISEDFVRSMSQTSRDYSFETCAVPDSLLHDWKMRNTRSTHLDEYR
jgi:hypothetical protein